MPKAKIPAQHALLRKLGQGPKRVGTRLEACVFLLWVVEQTTQFYPTGCHKEAMKKQRSEKEKYLLAKICHKVNESEGHGLRCAGPALSKGNAFIKQGK